LSTQEQKWASGHRARVLGGVLGIVALLVLEGCYYVQAVRGHMDVMHRSRSVTEVLDDPDAPQSLKDRLELVQDARRFSVEDLELPDNESYRSYADLEREFVVWNVLAAPEFSLQAKQWCFPVAGCVAYRGYFAEEAAHREAEKLGGRGYDVAVGGVSAYSTLGRFSDPVLNTMMRWSDTDVIVTLFHELAHQKVYVKNDTQFNESFATAVAEIGIERWFAARKEAGLLNIYLERKMLHRQLLQLVEDSKIRLAALYDSDVDESEMRRRKDLVLSQLSRDVNGLLSANGGSAPSWLGGPLNNARLVSLGLYEGWLAAFRELYKDCNGKLACFYDSARELAELPQDERYARLIVLTGEANQGGSAQGAIEALSEPAPRASAMDIGELARGAGLLQRFYRDSSRASLVC
jgi:predicted aminopeptidase